MKEDKFEENLENGVFPAFVLILLIILYLVIRFDIVLL